MWDQLADEPPEGLADAGNHLLIALQSELQMDDELTLFGDRQLWWWGTSLPLQLAVTRPRLCLGDATIRLSAFVSLVRDVSANDETVTRMISVINKMASVAALVWLPRTREVVMHVSHYSYDDNQDHTRLFAPLALADSRGHSDTELSNNSANTSTGFCHPSVLRGRSLSSSATISR